MREGLVKGEYFSSYFSFIVIFSPSKEEAIIINQL